MCRSDTSISILAILATIIVAGCADAPATNPARTLAAARAGLPDRFAHETEAVAASDPTPAAVADLANWPHAYNDARLDALVATVLAANHDLITASARLREARATATQVASSLWPTLDLSGFGAHAKQLRNTAIPNIVNDAAGVDIQASWEIDLFGGNSERIRAAQFDVEAAAANVWAVQVALIAETTTSYLELAGTDERLAVFDRNIANQTESLRLAIGTFNAGLSIELTVQRATARLGSTRTLRPPLEQTRAALVHRLAVLSGVTPEAFAAQFAEPIALPKARPADPHLVPSELLARRPDLRAAQAQLFAAASRSDAARTDLLPKFFLSGLYGYETVLPVNLLTMTSPVYLIGAVVTLPLFNAGRIRARIAGADAQLDAAAAGYEQALLKALEDVENAYAAVIAAVTSQARLGEAIEAATSAEAQARRGFELGRVDYATLLDVQRERLAVEDSEVQARMAAAVAYASLFRAFGGGWTIEDPAPVGAQ